MTQHLLFKTGRLICHSYLALCAAIFFLAQSRLAAQTPELLYYRFDGSGTSVPNQASSPPSGTATATIVGDQTIGSTGQCNEALIGTGSNSSNNYVNTGWTPNLGGSSWTLSLWINNVPNYSQLWYIFGEVNTNGFRCFTNGVAGQDNFWLRGGGLTDVPVNGGALAGPQVITFVYDNTLNNVKAYLNGVLVNTVAQGTVNITGTGAFKVGGYASNFGLAPSSRMDEFRLYNRALSATEVAAIAGNICLCYVDADGDGYGDASDPGVESQQGVCPMGTVDNNEDCDDTNPNINPEGTEVCDNLDNDCSGVADDGNDMDSDGYSVAQGDCDDCNSALNPGQTDICGNGIDDNCNGQIDEPVVFNPMECGIFYGFSPFQDSVWTIDSTMNYAIIERRAPTLDGFTVTGINGAAKNPLTGQIYAIVKVSGVSGRVLCIFNPADATMTQVGNLGDNFSSITFSPSGQLFGVTGNGATVPETLYDIDPSNASKTLLTPLGNGADGEVICYNPDDNMIYHWSGNGTVVYEKILPVAPYTITNIPIIGTTNGETFGAAYIGNNKFLISNISSSFNIITTNGTWGAAFGSMPDDVRGLPFASCDVTCYADADGDGYGDPNAPQVFQGACGVGYVQNSQDCDDNDDSIYPCAQEICDGKDNDCDGLTDTNDPGFVDNTPPTVSCAGQATLVFNGENSIQIDGVNSPVNLQIQANDNCGVQSITISPATINANQVGQTVPVTITVTDFKGATATCNSSIVVSGLPEGWSAQPNGVGCSNGNSAQYNAGTGIWTATSTNCFYGPPFTSDATSFVQRTLCGDGSITAHVTSINGNGWAGVVMRESNAPGAKKVQLMTNLNQFHRREFRTTNNGAAQPQQISSNNRHWLRIVRAGNQFTLSASANGISWFPVGAQNIAMGNCIQIGLVASNFTANSTVTATFAGVSFTGNNGTLMAPLTPLPLLLAPHTFEVYPNPTSGDLNVNLTQYLGRSVRMELYSIEGKLLQFSEIEEVQTAIESLNLSEYSSGMYLVKVKSRGLPDVTKRVVLR